MHCFVAGGRRPESRLAIAVLSMTGVSDKSSEHGRDNEEGGSSIIPWSVRQNAAQQIIPWSAAGAAQVSLGGKNSVACAAKQRRLRLRGADPAPAAAACARVQATDWRLRRLLTRAAIEESTSVAQQCCNRGCSDRTGRCFL